MMRALAIAFFVLMLAILPALVLSRAVDAIGQVMGR